MTSKHFCLKWTKFQASILNAFESLQNTEDLADVTLSCEGISIKAHKFILSACSPYFRSIFKENPCSHPIVILKDVSYIDLIAIVNFMYHGEVMISEEQLPSFLQTAMVLQVSGLINSENPYTVNRPHEITKSKVSNADISGVESCSKKVKMSPKNVKNNLSEANFRKKSVQFDTVNSDKPKTENIDSIDGGIELAKQGVTEADTKLENQMQSSILEAALEVKSGSILERSLTSAATKSTFVSEKPSTISVLPEIHTPKTLFIPGKTPINENDILKMRSSSESSSSPSTFDRASEFIHPAIKIEEPNEMDIDKELIPPDEPIIDFAKTIEVPHHSSQCGNCPHCGKVYSNQSALKYHVRLMHSDLTNMYCCHLCPESFDYREGYKKHMADVHSIRN